MARTTRIVKRTKVTTEELLSPWQYRGQGMVLAGLLLGAGLLAWALLAALGF